MSKDDNEATPIDAQEALRLLDDARGRLRTAIWALHGMHQDMNALAVDDLADIEHLLTEILDNALTPSYEAMTHVIGRLRGRGSDDPLRPAAGVPSMARSPLGRCRPSKSDRSRNTLATSRQQSRAALDGPGPHGERVPPMPAPGRLSRARGAGEAARLP